MSSFYQQSEVSMPEDLCEELSIHEQELREWLREWYGHASSAGFIRSPFVLDHPTAERLEGYFEVGLTPMEGARLMFCLMH